MTTEKNHLQKAGRRPGLRRRGKGLRKKISSNLNIVGLEVEMTGGYLEIQSEILEEV